MSREALSDFLRAVERHRPLRREAAACTSDRQLLDLARSRGFSITEQDLANDHQDSSMGQWFATSRIRRSFHPPSP